jgi:DNA-binding PadR family transcriptional regulator
MVRDGLITTRRIRRAPRPDRQLLALTGRGRETADKWLFDPGPSQEIVVRLAVARLVIPDRFEELATTIAEERAATLRQLRVLRAEADQGFQAEAVDSEVLRVQGELRWIARLRERQAEILARPRASRPASAVTRYA